MAEETKKEVAAETPVAPTPAVEAPTPVAEDLKADSKKTTVAPPPAEEKSDESKALAVVETWENSKKAALEAKLKKIEEQLEKKKAEYAETMKNKVASIHKEAEEKRAMVEAKRGEEVLKAEEMAAKYRATGQSLKKLLGCF
ncbi:hypothetical protein GOBAR_DD23676 [Gossypium barbadense]|nr:hypothetical protein GOBAR_DD23676 [Gossypium barbadense]